LKYFVWKFIYENFQFLVLFKSVHKFLHFYFPFFSLHFMQTFIFLGFTFSPPNRNFILKIQVTYLHRWIDADTSPLSRILFPMFLPLIQELLHNTLTKGTLLFLNTFSSRSKILTSLASIIRSPLIFIGTCGNTRDGSILAFHNKDTRNTLCILSKCVDNSNR
jgi:hypothetical protein